MAVLFWFLNRSQKFWTAPLCFLQVSMAINEVVEKGIYLIIQVRCPVHKVEHQGEFMVTVEKLNDDKTSVY